MKERLAVIAWVSPYTNQFEQTTYTQEKQEALVNRIRKRRYNFNHFDHEFMDYCVPVFSDNTICMLTKSEFDKAFTEAYKDYDRGARLLPSDIEEAVKLNDVLYEKQKFVPHD